MGREIERKFLVKNDTWRAGAEGIPYVQGYLSRDADRTVRVRRAGTKAFLTIKGKPDGISRAEFEYEIPLADTGELLALCVGPLVEKTRYRIPFAGHCWEVDEFHGANAGLIVAEIELTAPEDAFEKPDWLGEEVSDDPRYANSRLSECPYSTWPKEAGTARGEA
jgi:adenylate cyclase